MMMIPLHWIHQCYNENAVWFFSPSFLFLLIFPSKAQRSNYFCVSHFLISCTTVKPPPPSVRPKVKEENLQKAKSHKIGPTVPRLATKREKMWTWNVLAFPQITPVCPHGSIPTMLFFYKENTRFCQRQSSPICSPCLCVKGVKMQTKKSNRYTPVNIFLAQQESERQRHAFFKLQHQPLW